MVVFFDIDGTIVDNETQIIPASAIWAIEELGKAGHLAVVNTGRPYSHIDPRIRKIPFGGWICGCGMEIRINQCRLSYCTLEESLCQFAVEQVRKYNIRALYEADDGSEIIDGIYSEHPSIHLEIDNMRKKGFSILPLSEHPRFMKFVTFDAADSDHEGFIAAMAPYFTIIDRGNTMLEFLYKGCSKANGMTLLLDQLGISPDDTMAIGDSTNDLPMFSVAKHTVCMGNGMDALKQISEYITDSVLENGIAIALHHFHLIPPLPAEMR